VGFVAVDVSEKWGRGGGQPQGSRVGFGGVLAVDVAESGAVGAAFFASMLDAGCWGLWLGSVSTREGGEGGNWVGCIRILAAFELAVYLVGVGRKEE